MLIMIEEHNVSPQSSSDHRSQAALGLLSTWMGDCLGTAGVVGFLFLFYFAHILEQEIVLNSTMEGHDS